MAIVIGILVLLLVLMYTGWRARQRRQRDVAAPLPVPADLGAARGTFNGKYVATTAAGRPLDRIAVRGLGFRSAASLTVTDTGLLVQRPGSDDLWIPRADIVDRRTATWTIDRVVERDGLELVEWRLGDNPVDSYFRLAEPLEFERALEQLLPNRAAA
jgi:hypothetical protein